MYNHNKAQQSKNRVHISWDILYDKVWDENTYPLPNLNGGTVEVRECIRNITPHFAGHVIT